MADSLATATLLDLNIENQMSLLLNECTVVLRPGANIDNVRRALLQLHDLSEALPQSSRTASFLEAMAETLWAAHEAGDT